MDGLLYRLKDEARLSGLAFYYESLTSTLRSSVKPPMIKRPLNHLVENVYSMVFPLSVTDIVIDRLVVSERIAELEKRANPPPPAVATKIPEKI